MLRFGRFCNKCILSMFIMSHISGWYSQARFLNAIVTSNFWVQVDVEDNVMGERDKLCVIEPIFLHWHGVIFCVVW